MQDYGEIFAQIYNQKWGGFAEGLGISLEKLFAAEMVVFPEKTLLDLCCGTGQLSKHFLAGGYRIVGIDLSEHMLHQARENNAMAVADGRARFIQADAADFALEQPVSFTVSTYDALNHLPDMAALTNCFSNVYRDLCSGGLFVFDLNTRLGLMRWNHLDIREDENFFLVNRGEYDGGARAFSRITGFMRQENGLYARFYEEVYNTAFFVADVDAALAAVGFSDTYHAVYSDLLTPLDDPEEFGRIFFISRKR
jgi:SAM-dependent methyltransferase